MTDIDEVVCIFMERTVDNCSHEHKKLIIVCGSPSVANKFIEDYPDKKMQQFLIKENWLVAYG